MFTYLHCYMPETWEAQIKAGLVRLGDGIRFPQSIDLAEPLKFNNLAKIGGELYNYVKETRCPFYIDRLQGGCFLEQYPYDMALVDEYRALLGDRFWGFQMHEWGSNLKSDLDKIAKGGCVEWTAKGIREAIHRVYPFEHTFVESMSVEEYASLGGPPKTWQELVAVMKRLYDDRQAYTNGDLLPCNSYYLAPKLEIEAGTKRMMPEIGWQITHTQVQLAYVRGMAKAAGIPFGTYYEPWGGAPFSACCYQADGLNEWNINAESFPFQTAGGNGGSSRSLQRRLHLYSYMAGAEFMSEEWGMCNTFCDWKTFELSPYGQVKKEFLDFVDRYPNIGKPVTPCAIVLPADMPVIDIALSAEFFMGYEVTDEDRRLRTIVDAIRYLCTETAPMLGTETHRLMNGLTPDAIDIIHEDSATLSHYDILVDCTSNPDFAAAYKNKIKTPAEARAYLREALPVTVDGGVSMQITYNKDTDTHYLLLLNNSGVERSVAKGEVLLPEGELTVNATLTHTLQGKALTRSEGNAILSANEDGSYRITIPSGGWFFAEIP